jgi:hypothetical protein
LSKSQYGHCGHNGHYNFLLVERMPTLREAGSYYVGKHPSSAANLIRGLPKPKKPTKPKRTSKFKGTGQNPNS